MLLHVPKASPTNVVSQALISSHNIGTTENAQTIPRIKANAVLIVIVRFHATLL